MDLKEINHGFLSYSGLSSWQNCPYKFWLYYIDKSRINSDSIYSFYGWNIHSIMEKYFQPKITKEEFVECALPEWERLYFDGWKDSFIDPKFHLTEEARITFYEQGISTIKNKLPKLHRMLKKKFGDYTIYGKEKEIIKPLYNAPNIKGFLDLIISHDDGLTICDYKAVKDLSKWKRIKPLQYYQLNLYEALLRWEMNVEVGSCWVIFPRVSEKEHTTIIDNPSTELDRTRTQEWVNNILVGIQNDIFFKNKTSGHCFLCEYNKSEHCP